MATDNKQVVRRAFEEAWSEGRLDVLDEIVTRDFVGHQLSGDEPIHGPEGLKEFVGMLREGIPDLRQTIDDLVAEGDRVAVLWTAKGTHDGFLMGIEPTGKKVEFRGTGFLRFENGRVAEAWMNPNMMGLFRRLGVTPQLARA